MLVSVCIPAYNQPELLSRTLQSVLAQVGCAFEVLIGDDSTNDDVQEAVRRFPDSRIRYQRNPQRLGAARNWNALLEASRGDFIKFMHHDDWFSSSHALHRLVEAAVAGNADFIFSASTATTSEGLAISVNRPRPEMLATLRHDPARLLGLGNFIGAPSATMFKRDPSITFDATLQWLVDMDFYISYLRRRPILLYLDTVLVHTTAGSSHQLTATSAGNPVVELHEWDSILRKHRPRRILERWRKMVWIAVHYPSLRWRDLQQLDVNLDAKVLAALGGMVGRQLRRVSPSRLLGR